MLNLSQYREPCSASKACLRPSRTTKLCSKENLLVPGSKDAYETALKRNSTCSVSQKGPIYDQVAFHSALNTVLNLPSTSVTSLQWEISKSNRLLISPHLFSISVENWLSRGVWHREVLEEGEGGGVILHCWRKTCLNFHLQFWQERTLKSVSLFHLIFMCATWKMLL